MDDLMEFAGTRLPQPSDPDFFTPQGNFASAVIRRERKGFLAQAERGRHKGPILLQSECLRGLGAKLRRLGWRHDQVEMATPIPLSEMPSIEPTYVPPHLQEHPALAIANFEGRLCRAYCHQDPEDQELVHQAFQKVLSGIESGKVEYGHVDTFVDRMDTGKMLNEFDITELCQLQHSKIFMKDHDFEMAVKSEIAPLVFERIRLSAWHNHASQLTWSETAQIYNSLRSFSVGLPDFAADFDHTRSCNPKGYSAYFCRASDGGHGRVYLDGELAYFISYKGKPVLVLSFNVSKLTREARPAVFIRQIQMTEASGNRWLYKLPCHYVEHFLIRMREAFSRNNIYLIRGDALGKEITKSYQSSLKMVEARLKANDYYSANGRADDEKEAQCLRRKIRKMRREVIARLRRNYARRSLVFHRYLRRRNGDYWKLRFRDHGEFVSARGRLEKGRIIQQVQEILDKENPCNVRVDRGGIATCRDGTPCCQGCRHLTEKGCAIRSDACKFYFCKVAWGHLTNGARDRLVKLGQRYTGPLLFRGDRKTLEEKPPLVW